MPRRLTGWFGLVFIIALAATTACNLSDPLGSFESGDSCATDDDCIDGSCVASGGALACECDEGYAGGDCRDCDDGYFRDESEACVPEMITPDMGMMADEPCLEVTPDPLDFGEIELGRAAVLSATITNCSEGIGLDVEDVTTCFVDAAGDCVVSAVFELVSVEPELPVTIEPGASATARVRFTPPAGGLSVGSLDVTAGELNQSIELTGSSMSADCLNIAAEARTGRTGTWGTALTTPPFTSVELRAVSTSGAGSIVRHEWALLSRPMASTAQIMPDNTTALPTLLPDRLGEYVVEVTTYNADDEPSCAPATINISAEPDAALWLELTWDTPGDADQFDQMGADIDVHLLHPNGQWNMTPWDAWHQNNNPDWSMDPNGRPRIVRNDSAELGPEILALNAPEDLIYRVGAYCANDAGFGRSSATMRIFIDNALAYTNTTNLGLRDFWFVGSVDWAARSVTEVNQVTLGFP